MICKTDRQTPT